MTTAYALPQDQHLLLRRSKIRQRSWRPSNAYMELVRVRVSMWCRIMGICVEPIGKIQCSFCCIGLKFHFKNLHEYVSINLLYTYYTSIYRFLTYFLRILNDSNKYIGTTCSSRFDSFFKIKERATFKDIFSIPSVLVYELNQSLRTIRKKNSKL